jgi:hypothetical protein
MSKRSWTSHGRKAFFAATHKKLPPIEKNFINFFHFLSDFFWEARQRIKFSPSELSDGWNFRFLKQPLSLVKEEFQVA